MSFDNVWTYDKLWLKAKVYMQKALSEHDREGDMFPFWSAIALEFVARATLAKVHPALLADPISGEHLLYSFGFQKSVKFVPISIPTKTVIERCETVVPNFTKNEVVFLKEFTIRRNTEIHSGALGFDNFPTKKWLSKYYKVIKILLDFQEKTLSDFVGKEEATAAEEMIAKRDANLEKIVKDRISKHNKYFLSLTEEVKAELRANYERDKWGMLRSNRKEEKCPACESNGILEGKLISMSDGRAIDTEIVQNFNFLPTSFKCNCCEIELTNHLELDVLEMGGQFKMEEVFDPREYFDISNFEPDFDYGND